MSYEDNPYKNEHDFKKRVMSALDRVPGVPIDYTLHEGTLIEGIPDVSFGAGGRNGWIEAKFIKDWPKKPDTPVRIDHFTGAQRQFLKNRGRAGGRCFVMLGVGSTGEVLLFNWRSIDPIGSVPRETLLGHAMLHHSSLRPVDLLNNLIGWEE